VRAHCKAPSVSTSACIVSDGSSHQDCALTIKKCTNALDLKEVFLSEVTGLDADRQSALAEISRLKVSVCACTLQGP